jgi:hypothetical protein
LDTPCVEFEGARNRGGYGTVGGGNNKRLAHRAAYCEHHGVSLSSIDGLVVRHRCDNPPCINPEHLELGTHADNVRDRVERGRERHPNPARGERHGMAKLTAGQVEAIRKEYVYRSPTHNTYALAKKYGVSQRLITKILNGDLWHPSKTVTTDITRSSSTP